MKKFIVVTLIMLIPCLDVFSQTVDWSYKFGGSSQDNCHDFEIDGSNNIYLTGGICNSVNFDLHGGSEYRTAEGTDNSNIFVAVYNANMELKTAFVLNSSSWNYATDIEIDEGRNIYISGYYSGTIDFNPSVESFKLTSSESHFFVAKYDSIGSFKWAKNISRKKDNWGSVRSTLSSDINSNVYLSAPDTLCKVDQNGDILWSLHTNGFAVFDGKSNFYILSNSLTPWESETYDNLKLQKIDTTGNVLFDKEIISNSSNCINGFITYDKSGKLLINGDYWGKSTFNGKAENTILQNGEMICCIAHTSDEYPVMHEYFAKFDTLGNVIWAYGFGSNGPNPYILETTSDGTIFSLGFLNFSADFDHTNNIAQLTNTGYGNYIAKYDSLCNFQAATEFMGGSYNDFIGGFKIYSDLSTFICGHFFNTIELNLNGGDHTLHANPPEDNFIVKYSDFNINDFTITDIYETKHDESKIIVYPNPVKDLLTISFPKETAALISIFSATGNELYREEVKGLSTSIDLSGLNASGIILLKISADNRSEVFKVVLR